MILTLETLLSKGACIDQCRRFRDLFGEQVDVTPALCESVALMFDWTWAARAFLPPQVMEEYGRIRWAASDENNRMCAAAEAECERTINAAVAEYSQKWGQRHEAMGPAPKWSDVQRIEYDAHIRLGRATRDAWDEYRRACARTFGELYNRSEHEACRSATAV